MNLSASTISLFAVSMALVAGAGWAAWGELEIFGWDRSQPSGKIAGIIAETSLPPALTSRRELLLTCNQFMGTIFSRLEGEDRESAFLTRCDRAAQDIANLEQANSLAWAVSARAAAMRGDYAGMNDDLARSFATGPSDQWLVSARFDIAEQYLDELDTSTRADHLNDIMIMLNSDIAINQIVQLYLINADFRERLVGIVEGLPNQNQRDFLADVQRISTGLQESAT